MKQRVLIFAALLFLLVGCLFPAQVEAAEVLFVPDNILSQNVDGRQLLIKTYTLSPEENPSLLMEEPFERDGFLYTYSDMTKLEQPFEERKSHFEVITLDSVTNDLSNILAQMEPMMEYDDGYFSGVLYLDHSSLVTKASSYTNQTYRVTETKQIGNLDRNDSSYVPTTTVKDGQTLQLSSVQWAVQGTSMVGDALIPSSYMATATYARTGSRSVANGYVTTAKYVGEVVASGISAVQYTVTYAGEPIVVEKPFNEVLRPWLFAAAGLILLALFTLAYLLFWRRNTKIYFPNSDSKEFELVDQQRINSKRPHIDLSYLKNIANVDEVRIEIERRTVGRLFGRQISIQLPNRSIKHLVEPSGGHMYYWFKIDLAHWRWEDLDQEHECVYVDDDFTDGEEGTQ